MTALNLGGIELADLIAERLDTPPAGAVDGRMYYDTTLGLFQFRQGGTWSSIAAGGGSALPLSGGTLTGPLILNDGSPAASRQWTLNTVSSGGLPVLGVTFNIEVYGAVGDGVTDDYPAIRDAWNAMIASPFGGVLFCPRAVVYRCVVTGRLIHQTDGQYCVFPIPARISDGSTPKVRYGIVGVGEAYVTRNYAGTTTNTALHTTSSTIFIDYSTPFTYSASFGHPSFIGAPDADKAGLSFSNTHFSVEHMTFRQPNNPSVCSVNLDNVSTANVYDFCGDINAPLDTSVEPTHPTGVPLLMPRTGNAINGQVDKYLAWGYYGGYPLTEHSDGCSIEVVACKIGAFFRRTSISHPYHIARFFMEECPWGVAGLDPTQIGPNGGVAPCPGATLIIGFWDVEDFDRNNTDPWMYPGATAAKKAHVYDPTNTLKGFCWFNRIDSGAEHGAQDAAYVNGANNFGIYKMTARDAAVTRLSGGTPPADVPPNAPTIGSVVAGNASVSVAFTPAGTGGLATSFTATSTPGNITATGASSPINVTGLTNGTTYTFKVHASNSAGNSAESAASGPATPSGGGGPTTYAADNFNRADSNTSLGTSSHGEVWTALDGTWGIKNNAAYQVADGGGDPYNVACLDAGHGLVTYTIDFIPRNGPLDAGLATNIQNLSNLVFWDISGTADGSANGMTTRLFHRSGGAFQPITSAANLTMQGGTAYTLKMVIGATQIDCYMNNTLVFSSTGGATGLESQTKFGVMMADAQSDTFTQWDNLLITS